jgi:lipoyl(octanoyl) transferase
VTNNSLTTKNLGKNQDFQKTWQAMVDFTQSRTDDTADELWLLEHAPVFTLGQAGDPSHVLNAHDIPLVKTDRGGQVTYHGPGQIILYVLLNLKKNQLGIRSLVSLLEDAVIDVAKIYGITAAGKPNMPGVYVNDKKIASIGLRIKKGCSYHGLSFNVDMDLMPFDQINPCGYQGLQMTQLKAFDEKTSIAKVKQQLLEVVQNKLSSSSHKGI